MRIAFIADDKKKELLAQFCLAYSVILKDHTLCATSTTARMIEEATGLKVQKLLSGYQGGIEVIRTKVTYNEVDLLLYFRDPKKSTSYGTAQAELFSACDFYKVPYATNMATAEALIHALGRGDLDWKNGNVNFENYFNL